MIGHVFPSWFAIALAATLLQSSSRSTQASGAVDECTEAALLAAVSDGGTVTFGCEGDINLSAPITVETALTLDGMGRDVVLSGAETNRLFIVRSGGDLTLIDLTLVDGRANGGDGAAGKDGGLARGGAIFSEGKVRLINCQLVSNLAVAGAGGEGAAGGNLSGSRGESGGNGGAAEGGAIYNTGVLEAERTQFRGNGAFGGEGGEGGAGATGGNGGDGGSGGHGGGGRGGAVFTASGGSAKFTACEFVTNRVDGANGGIGGPGSGFLGFDGEAGAGGEAVGGALFGSGGSVVIGQSTFVANSAEGGSGAGGWDAAAEVDGQDGAPGSRGAGGAVFSQGLLTVTNSTLFGNFAVGGQGGSGGKGQTGGFGGDGGDGGGGGSALGGAIFHAGSSVAAIVNATFATNSVSGGLGGTNGLGGGFVGESGKAGAAGTSLGADVFGQGQVGIKNSLFDDSVAGASFGGQIVDRGYNLSAQASGILMAEGSQSGIDLRLLGLDDNGGPTRTMSLATNSPAVNAITVAGGNGCPAEDQRGAVRSDPCDIGAYEFSGVGSALTFRLADTNVVLSWPQGAGDFELEQSPSLRLGTWSPVTNSAELKDGAIHIAVPLSNTNRFFRLKD